MYARSSHPARHRGFTLIEVVMALVIAGILVTAMMSFLFIGLKAVPSASDGATNTILAGRVLDQIAGELETALLLVAQTPTSIAFTVPPRGTDTTPERISYSWSGNPGDPLTRQYNQGPVVAVVDAVSQFSLTPTIATFTESYPGMGVEDASQSLLLDYSSTSNVGNQSVNASNSVGQLFTPGSWPAGVVGWRPTCVAFEAMQHSLPAGSASVQLWLPNSTQLPTYPFAEQYTLTGSTLPLTYTWQSFNFSTIPRLAPSAGICLVLQGISGNYSLNIASDNANPGLLQGNVQNGQTTWQYQSNNALQARLYGTLTRSNTTQYATSKYLSALTLSLRAGSSQNLAVQTTAQCLNHPELLSLFFELKFNSDPTKLDSNGDGISDWVQQGGGTFTAASLGNGTWQAAGGVGLNSQPGDNYSSVTMIDVRFNAVTTGSWAGFSMNAARSGSVCAPVIAQIALMADGTQTLTVWRKLTDSTTDTLLSVPQLPASPTDLHMVIDPSFGSVGITINGTQYGSFAYNRYASSDPGTSASLSSSGSAQFSYFRLREVQP